MGAPRPSSLAYREPMHPLDAKTHLKKFWRDGVLYSYQGKKGGLSHTNTIICPILMLLDVEVPQLTSFIVEWGYMNVDMFVVPMH